MIAELLNALANGFSLILLARVISSWLPVDPQNPVVRILDQLTEPVLAPIRRLLPPLGQIDFSPLVALLLLELVRRIVLGR